MKKLLLFLLALTLTLTFSACANNKNAGDNNQNGTSPSVSSDVSSSVPTPNYVAPSDNNQSNVTADAKISRDKALEIALTAARISQKNIRDLEIDIDTENGVTVWEIDFESGNTDYSYDIDAATGRIIKSEKDTD